LLSNIVLDQSRVLHMYDSVPTLQTPCFDDFEVLTHVMVQFVSQGREVFIRSPWHQLRHPLIFYYGHVATLYINKLRVAGLIKNAVNEELEQIMEQGVDEMSWDDLSKNEMEWPDLRIVTEYRRTVYGIVKDVIMNGEWSFPIKINDPAWALIMGFEHERIHLETSSVLMRELPAHLVTRPAQFPKYHPSAFDGSSERTVQNEMIAVEAGEVQMGKPKDWPSFGWDNEYGSRSAKAGEFSASKFLITNGEFLEFVRSGGYGNRAYWTEAGWQWRVFRNILFPSFWCPDGPVNAFSLQLFLFDAFVFCVCHRLARVKLDRWLFFLLFLSFLSSLYSCFTCVLLYMSALTSAFSPSSV